jgi:Fe-S cluster biogenesis protein NfuA
MLLLLSSTLPACSGMTACEVLLSAGGVCSSCVVSDLTTLKGRSLAPADSFADAPALSAAEGANAQERLAA